MMSEIYFDRDNTVQTSPRIILVEGPDDGFFLDALLLDMKVPVSNVRVLLAKGKDRIASTLRPILKSHAFTSGQIERYAIIRDADDDATAAVNEVHRFLHKMNEPCPPRGGVVDRRDGRKVGLFLFPDSTSAGDLETLCMATATGSQVAHASEFIANAVPLGGHQDHSGKRIAQSYLAISSLPLCAGVGWATSKGVFDVKHNALTDLRVFLDKFIN